eukprot:7391441-Prymnesium_polylepis.2
MSGRDFLEGRISVRIGARVIENTKLRGPGHLGLDPTAGCGARGAAPAGVCVCARRVSRSAPPGAARWHGAGAR